MPVRLALICLAVICSLSNAQAQCAGCGADNSRADRERVTPGSESRTTEKDIQRSIETPSGQRGPDLRQVHPADDPIRRNTGQ